MSRMQGLTLPADLPLTFGVEFECVFVFHQSMLQNHLDDVGHNSKIIKRIPDRSRRDLNMLLPDYHERSPKYMGWALTSGVDYRGADEEYQAVYQRQFLLKGYRCYGGEILNIIGDVFVEEKDVELLMHNSFNTYPTNYEEWFITHDGSISGVTERRIREELGQRIKDEEEWDSHGVELVSRILACTDESLIEFSKYLTVLKGNGASNYGAFPTTDCGMHVHVGLQTPPDQDPSMPYPVFSMDILRHLAYILVMYEPSINVLFPSTRRPGSFASKTDLGSNLDNFLEEPEHPYGYFTRLEVVTFEGNVNGLHLNELAGCALEDSDPAGKPKISFARARCLIFNPKASVADIADLMGTHKGKLVNWSNIKQDCKAPPTIEFRQHEGCLDAESASAWVTFVVGLVVLADRVSKSHGCGAEYKGEGYPFLEWSSNLNVADLFYLMGLPEWIVDHFNDRIERFG